jgi:hypothetical protein
VRRTSATSQLGARGINPFVVLFDITIALTFIFIVYAFVSTLESSSALSEMNRKERQQDLRNSLIHELGRLYPHIEVKEFDEKNQKQILDLNGHEAFSIQENGSYQRICVYRSQFNERESTLTPEGERIFSAIGDLIREKWLRSNYITYINMHGICGYSEGKDDSERLDLSRSRADSVNALFETSGLVTRNAQSGTIPRSRVVVYGTGNSLYANFPNSQNPFPARVDIVLFYNDSDFGE